MCSSTSAASRRSPRPPSRRRSWPSTKYHAAIGEIIVAHEGTVERFAGDAIMVFFNDPVIVPNPAERALRMAVAVRDRTRDSARCGGGAGVSLASAWASRRASRPSAP